MTKQTQVRVLLADSGAVTGAFTLGGGVIGVLGTLMVEWSRRKREGTTRWDRERLLAYSAFIAELDTHLSGDQEPGTRKALIEAHRRAQLLASPAVDQRMFTALHSVFIFESASKVEDQNEDRMFNLFDTAEGAMEDCVQAVRHELGGLPGKVPEYKRTKATKELHRRLEREAKAQKPGDRGFPVGGTS